MSKQLENKVAIVTGAGKGIGRAIALAFAVEGAYIVIADKSEQLSIETAEAIKAIGRKAIAVTTDVIPIRNSQFAIQKLRCCKALGVYICIRFFVKWYNSRTVSC